MKKRLQGLIAGMLIGGTITGGVVFATNTTTLYDVLMNGIKIVVDGQLLNPTDANGNKVEPIIYNGTTYLPVRAVANAIGKPVYWDGPSFTVYLGYMDGKLEYPTEELSCDDNIGYNWVWRDTSQLKDNFGNTYSRAIFPDEATPEYPYEKICNMKFSKFKGTIYVINGSTYGEGQIIIKADGKTIYTSPELTKSSAPIDFNIHITGCYDLQISCTGSDFIAIGNGGFYQ